MQCANGRVFVLILGRVGTVVIRVHVFRVVFSHICHLAFRGVQISYRIAFPPSPAPPLIDLFTVLYVGWHPTVSTR